MVKVSRSQNSLLSIVFLALVLALLSAILSWTFGLYHIIGSCYLIGINWLGILVFPIISLLIAIFLYVKNFKPTNTKRDLLIYSIVLLIFWIIFLYIEYYIYIPIITACPQLSIPQ